MENYNITTEQNVSFNLQVANFGERFLAYFLDTIIIYGFVFLMVYIYSLLKIESVWYFILLGAPALFYHVVLEIIWNGQSIGKKWRKIKVVKTDGTPETAGSAIIRFLLRPIDSIYGLGMIIILATKLNQRLGDLAAGTCIIHTNKQMDLDQLTPKVEVGYEPVFDKLITSYLNDREINIVRKILKNRLKEPSHKNVVEAAKLMRSRLPITDNTLPAYKYLDQLVKDYDYYVLSEL
jgi:uncharacterized RDD family membrane protein YckC